MANTKMTKKQVVAMMMADEAIKTNEVYMEYLSHELELLSKKSANRKPSKKDAENEALKSIILEVLDVEVGKTVTEILKSTDELRELSQQKVSALVKSLVESGLAERHEDKKKATFTLVA